MADLAADLTLSQYPWGFRIDLRPSQGSAQLTEHFAETLQLGPKLCFGDDFTAFEGFGG